MKKTIKPGKKSAAKKPAAKKSPAKPKRKVAKRNALAQVLGTIVTDQETIINQQAKIIEQQERTITTVEQIATIVKDLTAVVDRLMQAEESDDAPDEALTRQPPVSDEVARMAQWICLNCQALFPGEELFGAAGERTDRCPTCGSDNIAIPERIEGADR